MAYNVKEHIIPLLHHVGFTVSDMDRSIEFYTKKLGFTLYDRWTEPAEGEQTGLGMGVPGAKIELAQVTGYGCMLEMIQYLGEHAGSTERIEPNHVGLGHVAFLVDNMKEFKQNMEAVGVEFCSEPIELSTSSWVHFYDPDGIRVEVMEFTPELLAAYKKRMNLD